MSSDEALSNEAKERQTTRILRSDTFKKAPVLRKLLEYLATETIAGKADQLKEAVIAVEVFGRDDFKAVEDTTIVRTSVSNLRQKLKAYREREGTGDTLILEVPVGRYAVRFRRPETDFKYLREAARTEATHIVDESAVRECLHLMGVPTEACGSLAKYILHSARIGASNRDVEGVLFPKEFQMERELRSKVRRFAELLGDFLTPQRVLSRALYFSKQKVAQTYRSWRSAIVETVGHSGDSSYESLEDKFLLIYRYFDATGRLMFAPQEMSLHRCFPTGGDHLLFFFVELVLDRDQAMLQAFPTLERLLGDRRLDQAAGLVFRDAEPEVYPLLHFTGAIAGRRITATASRKYFRINSCSFTTVAAALGGTPIPLEGFAIAEDTDDGGIVLHPMVMSSVPPVVWPD